MENVDFYLLQFKLDEQFLVSVKTKEVVRKEYDHFDILKRHSREDDVGWTSRHEGTYVDYEIVPMSDFEKLLSEQPKHRSAEIDEAKFLEAKTKAEKGDRELINERYNSSDDDDMGSIIQEEYRVDNASEDPYS